MEAKDHSYWISDLPRSAFYHPFIGMSHVLEDKVLKIHLMDQFILFLPSSSMAHYIYIPWSKWMRIQSYLRRLYRELMGLGRTRSLGNMKVNYFHWRQLHDNANGMEQINLTIYIDEFWVSCHYPEGGCSVERKDHCCWQLNEDVSLMQNVSQRWIIVIWYGGPLKLNVQSQFFTLRRKQSFEKIKFWSIGGHNK